jgi:hypothetical protein
MTAMTDTSRTELESNDQKLVEIPSDVAPPVHPPITHVSTPLDGPKNKPETESDEKA